MLNNVAQLPKGIDTSVPHPARVYDYWLGGKDNFAADRRAAQAGYEAFPGVLQSVQANRGFLARAVTHLVTEAGIRQFLDVGSGLPTVRNTHEIAQEKAPQSRVVYVDSDPVAVLHARVLLDSSSLGRIDFLHADARDPAAILAQAAATLDFGEPVAVLLLGLLHFLTDDAEADAIVAAFRDHVAPGSHLVISHLASDIEPATMAEFARKMRENGAAQDAQRTREQVTALFAGLELLDPGVVPVSKWRPGNEIEAAAATALWGGVARKR
jgi:O-methyltransferase involved in polyketide biosynthesis